MLMEIGRFLQLQRQKITKVAKMIGYSLGKFEKPHSNVSNAESTSSATFGKFWATFLLVTLIESTNEVSNLPICS